MSTQWTSGDDEAKKDDAQQERKKGDGDCMTPTATALAIFVGIVVLLARWVLHV